MEIERTFETPRWYWVLAVWLGIGLFDASQTVLVMRAEGMRHYWTRLFMTNTFAWIPWMLATPVIFRLGHRFSVAQWKHSRFWISHLSAMAIINLLAAGWVALWEELLNPFAASPGPETLDLLWLHKFYGGILSSIILYLLVLLIVHISETQRRFAMQQAETSRLNEQLTKAQLDALRRQIEPHFLFNTLNAIAALVREKRDDAAVNMISSLSDFLRRVVNDSERQQVSLSEELEFTKKYLDIQKARFADRLEFSVDVPDELLSAQVPSLILQPIIENAVKHGIAKRVQGGAVGITALRSNAMLTLSVYNDGPQLIDGWQNQPSAVGIRIVRTRLESLYGKEFELKLRNHLGGVEALISVPYDAAKVTRAQAEVLEMSETN